MVNGEWTEIKVNIDASDVETASAIASMTVPYGFYIEDYSDLIEGAREIAHIDLIDEELLEKDRSRAVIHIYIEPTENPAEAVEFLRARLAGEHIAHEIVLDSISEDDWANNWKKYFKPTLIGERLLILPEWESAPDTDRTILRMDPGAAFGTGTHATTKLCLTALESCVKSGDSVLDIGTGSGILSIASLLLGADSAVGVDIDSLAVKTARQNAEKNGFYEPQFTAVEGDLAEKISGKFDICVANIVADVIIRLCDDIQKYMNPDAYFIMSGIIDTRADDVLDKLREVGLRVLRRFDEGGWVALVAAL